MEVICVAPQLLGDYGSVVEGQQFECPDDIAVELLKAGKVRKPDPPTVLYETKPAAFETPTIQMEAPEVSAARQSPFRNGTLSDAQPAPVATESDSALPGAEVPEQGTPDRGGRRGRKRPRSR